MIDYRKDNFVYVQFGCHGSFNVYDSEPIPYMDSNHYGENWKVHITEADPTKYELLKRRYGNFPNVFVYNLGIYPQDLPFYSLNFEPSIEEEHTLTHTVYHLYFGDYLMADFSTLAEASAARDQKLEEIREISWITQVASYNVDSILSTHHLHFLPDLAEYLAPVNGIKTVTPTKFLSDINVSEIDLLFLAQSGCDYQVLSCFPFESVEAKHLAFKNLHMNAQQNAEIEQMLSRNGFTEERSWLLELSHLGYKKL